MQAAALALAGRSQVGAFAPCGGVEMMAAFIVVVSVVIFLQVIGGLFKLWPRGKR